jgi:hypothetical protein
LADRARQTSGPRRAKGRFAFGPSFALASDAEELERALLAAYRSSATEVLGELWEADVERLCGERWKPRPRSKVTRAGWCSCQIMLGGERVSLRRPRVRSTQGREIELPTFKVAAGRDLLGREAVEDVTAAITTGSFPLGRHHRDAIGLDFVERLADRMSAVQAVARGSFERGLLIASLDFRDQTFLGAVGIEPNGGRRLEGIYAGSPANEESVDRFLNELVAKHRRSAPPDVFFVGEDAVIHQAIRRHFGASAILQRSSHEKCRRVLGLLPSQLQSNVLESLLEAYARHDARAAERALRSLHKRLERDHPRAAAALAEGLPETLTLHRMGGGVSHTRARAASRTQQPGP